MLVEADYDEEHPEGRIMIRSWEMHLCQDLTNGDVLLGIILYNAEGEAVADIHWGLPTAKAEYLRLGEALKEMQAKTGRTDLGRTEH